MTGAKLLAEYAAGRRYFTGADLAGAQLRWANLARANLARANLDGANLAGANLDGANLTGANLTGANLARANLDGAQLRWANLAGANLDGANLTGANLTGANLAGANLTGANPAPGHAYAAVSWTGHGECGRQLSAYHDGTETRYFCGCFAGSMDALREYIAADPAIFRESRAITADIVERLIALQTGGAK